MPYMSYKTIKYICPKCNKEYDYNEGYTYVFWPVEKDKYGNRTPFCYGCLLKFLHDNIPLMVRKDEF